MHEHVHCCGLISRSGRAELLGGSSDPESTAERDRLILAGDKMQRGTDRLRDACRTAVEAEAVGASTLQDLHDQRQTIERSRGRLASAGAGLDRSRRILSAMGRRALANRILLWAMIGFLSLLILLLLYAQLFGLGGKVRSSSTTHPDPTCGAAAASHRAASRAGGRGARVLSSGHGCSRMWDNANGKHIAVHCYADASENKAAATTRSSHVGA